MHRRRHRLPWRLWAQHLCHMTQAHYLMRTKTHSDPSGNRGFICRPALEVGDGTQVGLQDWESSESSVG